MIFIDGSPNALSKPRPPKKTKKIHLEKNSLCFGKWNFLALILKRFLYFSKWNPALSGFSPQIFFVIFFYIFPQKTFSEKMYIFSKEIFSYISGNGILHFSYQAQKIKKKSAPGKLLILQETETPNIFYIFLKRKLFLCFARREL